MKTFKTYRPAPLFAVLVFTLLAVLAACQTGSGAKEEAFAGLGKARDAVPFMEKARTGTLPSGLKYYILENSMPEGRAFLTLAVNAGSVLETDEERGLAHFVEHMAFNGTERFPEAELISYLRSLGMRFGPEVNAYTSFDSTVYGIETTVEEKDGKKFIPQRALNIIDDWTRAVTFAPKDIDDERRVIMEEYRARLGADKRMQEQILRLLFKDSPYAERLPIGLPEIIENAPPEALTGFYQKWYRPDNMALIFVGDFDGAALEASLESNFLISAPEAATERPRSDLTPPKKGNFDAMLFTDPELSYSRVNLYYKQKQEAPRQDLEGYRESVIGDLIQTMLYYRFEEAASKPDTPYIWAGSGTMRHGYSSSAYVLTAEAKSGTAKAVLAELFKVKESLSRYGFAEGEEEPAKLELISYLEQQAAEKDRRNSGNFVNYFTNHFLEGETVPDIEWQLEAVKTLLPGISLKEINAAVKNLFANDDLLVFICAPESEKESLPSVAEIKSTAAEYRRMKIEPPINASAVGELIAAAPASGEITSESVDKETGAILWTLGNGMKIILKETANKNNEISLYAQSRGGALSVPDETSVSASLAAEMLTASGLGPYSSSELVKKLAGKQVSFSFWASAFTRGFQGYAVSGDISTLFQMIHLSFTQPRLDPEAVQIMLDNRRTSLERQAEDPFNFFYRELTRTIYGNKRLHPLESEDLEKADIDSAMEFILACNNPSDYTFVFTGNFDLEIMRSLAETYLASIPRQSENFNRWTSVDFMRPENVEKEIRKGQEEQSAVAITWFIPETYSDEKSAAAEVLNEYLDIILTDEIREKLGGVYSISPQISFNLTPDGESPGGEILGLIHFVCDPKRAVEIAAAVESRLKSIAEGNADGDAFAKAVEALLKSHEEYVQSNLYIGNSYANSAVIYRSPLSRLDRKPGLYQAVTINGIQEIMAKLLGGGKVKMILYPGNWPQ